MICQRFAALLVGPRAAGTSDRQGSIAASGKPLALALQGHSLEHKQAAVGGGLEAPYD
jgi:hypothetical protein